MELNVFFLNCLKYQDKETKAFKYRFSYVLNDSKARQDTEKFKGLNELCFYSDNPILFEKLKGADALTPMTLKVEQKPSASNPLKLIPQVTMLKTKDENISLL